MFPRPCVSFGEGSQGLLQGQLGRGDRSVPQGAIGKYTTTPVLAGGGCARVVSRLLRTLGLESGTGSGLRCGLWG